MGGGEFPRGTVTFLFSDIEDSTDIIGLLGDGGYAEIRTHHHRLLRQAFEAQGGCEIDTAGDGFFVAFESARAAVAAAVAAQRALAEFGWPEGARVRVRMGLHTAEPHVDETGYAGLGVHRAARICHAAHGGQILMSTATAGIVQDAQLPGVRLVDLGEHSLKGLAGRQRMFQLTVPGLPSRFDPPRTPEWGARIPGVGAFVQADLWGWRQVIRKHGDEVSASTIADYRRAVSAVIEAHGGIVIELVADNATAVFHGASDAVRAAVAIRAAVTEFAWPDGCQIEVAAAVHAGRWSGDPGWPAASTVFYWLMRLLQAAGPGQVLVSQTAAALLEGDPCAPRLRDLGEHALPDFDEPPRIYELETGA